jgi:DNA-binding helix-hairpin-helix protein with protein kinase domain
VVLFEILMEGAHPFAGFPVGAAGQHVEEVDNIVAGRSWVVDPARMSIPAATLSLDVLPEVVLDGFQRCFGPGHKAPDLRPAASWWADVLASAAYGLRTCTENPLHVWGRGQRCPWCALMEAGHPDLYSSGGQPEPVRRQPVAPAAPPLPGPAAPPPWLSPPAPTAPAQPAQPPPPAPGRSRPAADGLGRRRGVFIAVGIAVAILLLWLIFQVRSG